MALSIEEQRGILTEFIELYKFEPCLWRIKSKEYHDREKRAAAYRKLLEKLKEIDPTANKEMVVKKINNLRSNVRKEKKKYEESIKSGASADEVYQPKLWYYNLFDFLSDQETPRISTSNLDPEEDSFSETGKLQETENSHITDDQDSPSCQGLSTADNADSLIENENVPCSSRKTAASRSRPGKQKQHSLTNDVLATVQEHFNRPRIQDDRFDIIGKSFAIKLREMDKRQSLIAEKLISDIIFEAELGNLTLQHKCINMQEISGAKNRYIPQSQPVMLPRYSVSSGPSSYSSSSSRHIITPTPSPSPDCVQYNQSETTQLQLNNSQYNHYQPSQQSFQEARPMQNFSPYQEEQPSSENVMLMESTRDAASYVTSFAPTE